MSTSLLLGSQHTQLHDDAGSSSDPSPIPMGNTINSGESLDPSVVGAIGFVMYAALFVLVS
jgi:hypothetical protein